LDNRDHTTRHGIPVTSPARTLLDVAPAVSERELERAYDDALKQRLVTRHAVVELLSRAPDRPAADRLGRLAHGELRTTTVTRSQLEERFLGLIRRAGLPPPEVNAQLGPFTVDFLWAGQRLIVELDGYAFHSTRRSFEGDRARDLELGAAGFQVMRFTWRQLVEQPELVLARLTQRLTALQVQSGR
jgi:very-short-patch-repair endonuclease